VGATEDLANGAAVGRFVFLLSVMLLVFVLNGVLPVVRMTALCYVGDAAGSSGRDAAGRAAAGTASD
jgi:hypothetical protein